MLPGVTGRRALLRFLGRRGVLSAADASRLERATETENVGVHKLLAREGLMAPLQLATHLAEAMRLERVDPKDAAPSQTVVRMVKDQIAKQHEVLPIAADGKSVKLAMANPLDLDAIKAVEFATGRRVQPAVAAHDDLTDAINSAYRLDESLEQFLGNRTEEENETVEVTLLEEPSVDLRNLAKDAELPPVIKLADTVLVEGIKCDASDIHVETLEDGTLVRYRIDGHLEDAFRFPKSVQAPLTARFKVMAKLDITERRVPQDGRLCLAWQGRSIDFRVSSLPTQYGEKITMRLLDAAKSTRNLDQLGLAERDLRLLHAAGQQPQGMILVTGPTGSGKTSTLFGLIRAIFSPTRNIVTIENPIEYRLKGLNQVEVNEKQGLTFSSVLRSVLRQDPDVILVGEIRDAETARIAFQASQTGHLVLSTLHTNDAAATITRLVDLGIEPYVVASSVQLLVAQRLVRRVCEQCAREIEATPEILRMFELRDSRHRLRQGAGCEACRRTGYSGRVGLYEVIPISPTLSKLIESNAGEHAIRDQAKAEHRSTLRSEGIAKVAAGVTTVEEVLRVVQFSVDAAAGAGSTEAPKPADQPASPPPAAAPAASGAPAAPAAASGRSYPPRSYKALVVDDDPSSRTLLRVMIDRAGLGLTVLTAQDGEEALALLSLDRPDIIVLDKSMPGMDGFELCRRLRSDPKTAFVPVLIVTAHDESEALDAGFGAGADDYIVKPVFVEVLVPRLRRMLVRTFGPDAVQPSAPRTDARPGDKASSP